MNTTFGSSGFCDHGPSATPRTGSPPRPAGSTDLTGVSAEYRFYCFHLVPRMNIRVALSASARYVRIGSRCPAGAMRPRHCASIPSYTDLPTLQYPRRKVPPRRMRDATHAVWSGPRTLPSNLDAYGLSWRVVTRHGSVGEVASSVHQSISVADHCERPRV